MNLAKREKYFLTTAICVVAIILLSQFLILPFFEKRERLKRGISVKEDGLKEMAILSAEYQKFQKRIQGVQKILTAREKGFTLFSFLEKAANGANVKNNIKSMKPSVSEGTGSYSQSIIEMKLEELTLNQLTEFMHLVEKPNELISIKKISIKKNITTGFLDANIYVLTLI